MKAVLLSGILLVALALTGTSTTAEPGKDRVTERGYDSAGRLLWEKGVRTDVDGLVFERIYYHSDRAQGGGPAPSADAVTDCPSTKYVKAGWHWNAPYSAVAASNAALFDQAGNTWDA